MLLSGFVTIFIAVIGLLNLHQGRMMWALTDLVLAIFNGWSFTLWLNLEFRNHE